MTSKLIRGDALADDLVTWDAPEVSSDQPEPRLGDPSEVQQHLEKLRKDAAEQGFAEGRAAGLAAAAEEIATRTRALEQVLGALARPLEELDHEIDAELLAVIKAIGRQVIRREMRLDPAHLVGVIRECLGALPIASGEVVVRLHPDDAGVIRECMGADDASRPWRIEADPVIEPGGCIVMTTRSQIDGRLETRLGRTIATMFDDQRTDDDE